MPGDICLQGYAYYFRNLSRNSNGCVVNTMKFRNETKNQKNR